MPLYEFGCLNDHVVERFIHSAADLGAATYICELCLESMGPRLSVGSGLLYFESGKPRVIHNLGHEPVVVTSHEQHKRLMRERGVEWATRGRGERGCWV